MDLAHSSFSVNICWETEWTQFKQAAIIIHYIFVFIVGLSLRLWKFLSLCSLRKRKVFPLRTGRNPQHCFWKQWELQLLKGPGPHLADTAVWASVPTTYPTPGTAAGLSVTACGWGYCSRPERTLFYKGYSFTSSKTPFQPSDCPTPELTATKKRVLTAGISDSTS